MMSITSLVFESVTFLLLVAQCLNQLRYSLPPLIITHTHTHIYIYICILQYSADEINLGCSGWYPGGPSSKQACSPNDPEGLSLLSVADMRRRHDIALNEVLYCLAHASDSLITLMLSSATAQAGSLATAREKQHVDVATH
jgi:hypothetical protein